MRMFAARARLAYARIAPARLVAASARNNAAAKYLNGSNISMKAAA